MRKLLITSAVIMGPLMPLVSYADWGSTYHEEIERVYEPAPTHYYEPTPVFHEYRESHGPYFGSPMVRREIHYDADSRPRHVHEEHEIQFDDDDDD
jgi:hypothetical protein